VIEDKNDNENDDYDNDDKSMLLKARSCDAGLDSDESISSSEYGGHHRAKEPGSLLSLPAGAEPNLTQTKLHGQVCEQSVVVHKKVKQ